MSVHAGSKVLWKASSSRHDWRGGGPLRRAVTAAVERGLIGRVKRVEQELPASESLLAAVSAGELVDAILAASAEQGRVAELTLAGDDPTPWELFWNAYHFDAEEGWVDGLNTLWLTFD